MKVHYDGKTDRTTAAFLARALVWLAERGITVRRVLTDNGSAYRSHGFAALCRAHALRHGRTRPYRPRTNGKAERFIQTALRGWAYGRPLRLFRPAPTRSTQLASLLQSPPTPRRPRRPTTSLPSEQRAEH
jgi:transposase InsO family protein